MTVRRIPVSPLQRGTIRRRFASRWKGFVSRLPSGTGAGIGFSCLTLVGVLLLCERRSNDVFPGILTLVIGISGLLWLGARRRDAWIADRMEKQRTEQRTRRQKARHDRQEIERQETAKKKQTLSYAKQRAREAAEARRRKHKEQEESEAAQREVKIHAAAAATERLLSLSETELRQALFSIFKMRGMKLQPIPDEAECDMYLTGADAHCTSVARLVPHDRKAEAADVRALDAWRMQERADVAYLIALAGFSPSAVREASRLPVTLVEAYLLAHWSMQDERVSHDP